jgi:cell wall-associated NlpC family hydrolase
MVMAAGLLLGACSSPYKTATINDPDRAEHVAELARTMVGAPYKYGGLNPKTGFDCSGLVYFTHRSVGITLPRTSQAQYRSTRPVQRDDLVPGDLVFFRIRRSNISHVGIYVGDDRFVHAPSSGKTVRINSLENPYWDKHFIRGGRVF